MADMNALLESLEAHKPCISCGIKLLEESRELLRYITNGFTQYGLEYHVGDFIYIRPPENCGVLEIAQIMKIKGTPSGPSVFVRFFGRYDDSVPRQKHMEEGSSPLVSDEVKYFFFKNIPISVFFISVDCIYSTTGKK